ncbi:alpha/beta hydrolase [Nocardia sp. NPDC051030]|uniref:alpha/beta hydrolase n=1 Tax=Nocardia sp. NPDC051030 TaxID=3155162 RepID=UPI00343534EC
MPAPDFHPDLRMARYLPRTVVGPRRLRLIRRLIGLTPLDPRANAVVAQSGPHVPVRVFRPAGHSGPMPGLLWMHGGGTVVGRAAMEDTQCRAFADRLGIVVVSVDYRLAPEHPYPTPLEDCYTGLRWLAAQSDVDSARIAIGGPSAGGGLAAALALLARERGEFHPIFQLLVYPMLDDRTCARTDIDPRTLRIWSPSSNSFSWASYLGTPPAGDTAPELAVPARHNDLAGLPPAWIGVGTHDLFHDEDVDYARRLQEAGVACTLEVVPRAYHGFDYIEPKTPVSQAFFDAQVTALGNALNGIESNGDITNR